MEKILKYLWLFVIATCLNACNDEEALTPSGEELFPPKKNKLNWISNWQKCIQTITR